MPIDFDKLKDSPRILIDVELKPVAGTRIQPTGFPDLGPATYDAPDGNGGTVATLLVESAQSMANRLEAMCWDEATNGTDANLKGLPYVNVTLSGIGEGKDTTNSLLEFHRLNSPYIMNGFMENGTPFDSSLREELQLSGTKTEGNDKEGGDVAGVVNLRRLAQVCFKYDPNSLVHGIFLEKIAGRLRHPRAISAFIEASRVGRADSGGVKFDRALPKPSVAGVDAKGGYGNVPFHRTEFTAETITAFFSLDLAQIRGYGLGEDATRLLIVLSLWKVRRFLDSTMRLRSACELEPNQDEIACRYKDAGRKEQRFDLPPDNDLTKQLAGLIAKCKPLFADPPVTELTWTTEKKTAERKKSK